MSTFKKTIFLSNKENSNQGMAVLTLERKQNGIFCTLKSYGISKYSNLVLGLKSDDKIFKQNIMLDSNVYNFLLNQNINLEKNLGCVLLESRNDTLNPILWGSEKIENFKSQIVNNLRHSIQKLHTSSSTKQTSSPISNTITQQVDNVFPHSAHNNSYFQSNLNADMDKNINVTNRNINNNINNDLDSPKNDNSNKNMFANIASSDEAFAPFCDMSHTSKTKLQEFPYSQVKVKSRDSEEEIAQVASLFESSDEEIEREIDNGMREKSLNPSNKEHKFYSMIAEQLEELFDKYPRETNLENLVENSRWVKINYEDNDRYYVVGIIYLNNDIKYICYGVPGSYYSEPPRELKDYSQWLPTDLKNPYDNGYWVMYQDADTGENVLIN